MGNIVDCVTREIPPRGYHKPQKLASNSSCGGSQISSTILYSCCKVIDYTANERATDVGSDQIQILLLVSSPASVSSLPATRPASDRALQ